MKGCDFRNTTINANELWITLSSWILGVGILTLPRSIAGPTESSDGWISIAMGGAIALLFTWIAIHLATRFHGLTFFEYSTLIVAKPAAVLLTALMAMHFLTFPAYVTRTLADISCQYLFDHTPVEVVAMVFFLLLVYAASGSRISILRLNVLFLPIVLVILILVLLLGSMDLERDNLLPVLVTPLPSLWSAAKSSTFSVIGSDILLFYPAMLRHTGKATRSALFGVAVPIALYMFLYIVVIGILSREGAQHIIYPTIELAKKVEFPGIVFERFELIFFTIWIMTIFNSALMALDLSVWSMQMLFPRWNKRLIVPTLAAAAYLACMTPQNIQERESFGALIGYNGVVLAMVLPAILLLVAILRGTPKKL